MSLIDDVKNELRITNTAYDTEIEDLINTAKADLSLTGLVTVDDTDSLTKRAITIFCKANFGFDNQDSERLQKSYEMLRNHLSLSTDYAYYTVTINAGEQCQVTFNSEVKETNDSGQVIFYTRAKNHIKYTVNNTDYYVDITNDTTITVGE
jgi:hypothetical protein